MWPESWRLVCLFVVGLQLQDMSPVAPGLLTFHHPADERSGAGLARSLGLTTARCRHDLLQGSVLVAGS